ncbi:MAG: hypothetical protein IPN23_10790 [Elusimicrobia bacterium]|nr:hypothetical protein [Elusimicrobiota bacterium]
MAFWAPFLASAAAQGVGSLFGKKKTSQVPLETAEQKLARQKLMGFAESGKFGDFQAGEAVPLGYGDYGVTGYEQQGLSNLQQLLSQDIPEQYRLGDDALQAYLATDPTDVSAQFDPFKQQTERQIADSNRALKRNAGFAGGLYSTNTIRQLGDIQARGNETLTSELARLTDSALNRRLQAIPLAYQSAGSKTKRRNTERCCEPTVRFFNAQVERRCDQGARCRTLAASAGVAVTDPSRAECCRTVFAIRCSVRHDKPLPRSDEDGWSGWW